MGNKKNIKTIPGKQKEMPVQDNLSRKKPKNTAKVILFLLVLVFAIYGNTIPNHYALDDEFVTFDNPQIKKGFKAIPEIFTTRYVNNSKQSYDYRPIVKLTFAVEYALFKENPHISHFINVCLYFVLCVLLYIVLKILLQKYHQWLPLMIVILFAAHPAHSEVVDSLKNRDELLGMIGALAAWYFILKYTETKKWYQLILAVILFFLAYFSKSTVIVYIAAIPLSLYFFKDVKISKIILITAILLVAAAIFNMMPRMFLSPPQREILYFENPLRYEKNAWLRIGTPLIVVLFYIKLLIIPHPLLFYYGYNMIPIVNPLNPLAITSFIICIALVAVALILFRRKHIVSFSILFFFITISVFSNILKPPPGIVAERFVLLPSLGFIIAICALLFLIFKKDLHKKSAFTYTEIKLPLLLFLSVLLAFSIRTIVRNRDWRDFKTLYSHDIAYLQKSAKANSVYASLLYDELNEAENMQKKISLAGQAKKYYDQSLKIYPRYSNSWNTLGIIYFRYEQQHEKGMQCWKKAIEYDSSYTMPYVNIAWAYEEMNKPDSAELYYKKAIHIKRNFTIAYSKLGDLYYRQGKKALAFEMNRMIMETDRKSDVPYVNLGNYYLLDKDTVNAISMWEKAIEKQPANHELCNNLARYFHHVGNFHKADYYSKLSQQNGRK